MFAVRADFARGQMEFPITREVLAASGMRATELMQLEEIVMSLNVMIVSFASSLSIRRCFCCFLTLSNGKVHSQALSF